MQCRRIHSLTLHTGVYTDISSRNEVVTIIRYNNRNKVTEAISDNKMAAAARYTVIDRVIVYGYQTKRQEGGDGHCSDSKL